MKKGENFLKRMGQQKNFSVQSPSFYSRRFIRNVIASIQTDQEESVRNSEV